MFFNCLFLPLIHCILIFFSWNIPLNFVALYQLLTIWCLHSVVLHCVVPLKTFRKVGSNKQRLQGKWMFPLFLCNLLILNKVPESSEAVRLVIRNSRSLVTFKYIFYIHQLSGPPRWSYFAFPRTCRCEMFFFFSWDSRVLTRWKFRKTNEMNWIGQSNSVVVLPSAAERAK